MNKTKLSWTVSNIEKMHQEKKVLSFEHPIQRKSEQWNNQQKSLLLHSMLANYPVPNIYVLREDSQEVDEKNKPVFNYSVMDGKQRLTSVLSYIWGEFPLEENIPNIYVDEVEYEIAGKYFCDLDVCSLPIPLLLQLRVRVLCSRHFLISLQVCPEGLLSARRSSLWCSLPHLPRLFRLWRQSFPYLSTSLR